MVGTESGKDVKAGWWTAVQLRTRTTLHHLFDKHHHKAPTMSTTLPQSEHIRTRFLIISDTHSSLPSQNDSKDDVAYRPPLPSADVLLHCGDLTMVGLFREYEKTLDMLESIDAKLKLVIAGNHDISLDEQYYTRKGPSMHRKEYDEHLPQKAKQIWTGERARKAGVTYLEEGTHVFTLDNGAQLRVR